MRQLDMLYEGKAKKVYMTDDPEVLIVEYKDDATAFNGEKRGTIVGKRAVNNRMTNYFMRLLEGCGIPTHYIEELSDTRTAVKRADIVPLEVIVRNLSAGSFAKRYGVAEGIVFKQPTVEYSYKDDSLGDPLLNTSHALALGLAVPEDLALIREYAAQINHFLKSTLSECGVTLVDFKVEFGKLTGGKIVLVDEISPDTCRFWDSKTGEKLDKDRFRLDLGNVEGAYAEMMKRLGI
ncbi:MAG: phosphoribosylaminoimidazolesuccinocarboxamide synthase [Oscillospiraceae bacterium]|jgi:phosphoribosylaminoimidazole-succinocarboxamide synthase|nr:phosphoribosylaminoimidazolesuccinocarboxamide synthase [Oscillospiraceae bacterium]